MLKRGAKVIVRRRNDGKYLMLTGSKWPQRPDRSRRPDLPGGIVEEGESFLEGAMRELVEETGITLPSSEFRPVIRETFHFPGSGHHTELAVYLIEVDEPSIVLSWEHEAYEWLDTDEFGQVPIRKPYKAIIQRLIDEKILV